MKTVTSQKAGEVYYSHPNRIILFYGDGEVTGDYTKIGEIEAADDLKKRLLTIRSYGAGVIRLSRLRA